MIHILNGDALTPHLERAGIEGERLVWRDALVAGPAPAGAGGEPFRAIRAGFLAAAYGENRARCLEELAALDRALDAISPDEEVVLWFDRDLFCRVNLWCALHRLARHHGRLSLVETERFLCDLTPEQLRSSWKSRREADRADAAKWEAYTERTPEPLAAFAIADSFVDLHLSRFPSATRGLGAIELAILEIGSASTTTFRELFRAFARTQAAFGFGDLQLLAEVERLASLREPLLVIDKTIRLTARGRKVLAGTGRIDPSEIDLWLGGVHLSATNFWEWDERNKKMRRSP